MSEEKKSFREAVRALYRELDAADLLEVDAQILNRVMEHPLYRDAERVFLYVGIKQEIHTLPLVEAAYQTGKIVALPRSEAGGVMCFFRYAGMLKEGRFRIPEPTSEELLIPSANDLMIVPGLCFDRCGNRMGQGAGYYDRYLEKYSCVTVGLCREKMLVKKIPVSWNDLPVDYVITEDTVFDCKKERSLE